MRRVRTATPQEIQTARGYLLSHQEQELADKALKQDARALCKDEVKAFAECTKDKLFSIMDCKPLLQVMNTCVSQYTKDDRREQYRLAYQLFKMDSMKLPAAPKS